MIGWALVLAAILVHEGAHAAAAQAFGLKWRLFHRGPLIFGIAVADPSERQSVRIALAGPAASLALAAALVPLGGPWAFGGYFSALVGSALSWWDWQEARRALVRP